ncbi:glycerol-3-phosphate dehydrogenase subunit GlpB [Halorarius litoreus]|uniref:glycerol-3-phosphate dehydrogenase subunit GlpB n=1 Tax=Halorarius litoreus TaxID=2962676 RepID=UPI0020CDC82F|nr:glycerol-3-phosphate dehydrogenase subunit GlpB [Halorarius litoreus]
MAIEDDVLVVGGGLAGVTAALAARESGASVRLVSAKETSLRQASGLIDALGVVDGAFVTVPFAAIDRLPETHPYRLVGAEALRAGLDLFDDHVEGYEGRHTDANALVPTHTGSVKPTARYPESVTAGLVSSAAETLLVGFEALSDFSAPFAAAHLTRADVPFDVRGVTVQFPGDLRADAKVTRYAHLLDADDDVHVDGGMLGARTALAERVKLHLGDAERVGFPAVLGDEHAAEVRLLLEAELGVDTFEVPMGPPSLLGARLQRRLYDALDDAGVAVETGNPVVDVSTDDGRVENVTVERVHSRVPYTADQYVLATGGLVGKGIEADREQVREPVFDCHVSHPGDRYDWFADGAYGDHPFARFGVRIDSDARPLDASGDPEYANLRAAGAVVGGADFPAEKSGSGVSLATGHTAGRLAGEDAT